MFTQVGIEKVWWRHPEIAYVLRHIYYTQQPNFAKGR